MHQNCNEEMLCRHAERRTDADQYWCGWRNQTLVHTGRSVKCCSHFSKHLSNYSQILSLPCPCDLKFPLTGMDLKEMEGRSARGKCTNIHNIVIVKMPKDANFHELRCKYIRQGIFSPVGYYLIIQKNKVLIPTTS